jgi:5-methylcytosine-specific restriction enzyme A
MPRHPFYNTRTWKRLRKVKLITDPLCAVCGRPAADVDHQKAINAGGHPTEWDNLESLCHQCHSRKTLYVERMGKDRVPVKGCRADGTPLDPAHPWNRDTSVQGDAEIVRSGPFKRKHLLELKAEDRAALEKENFAKVIG